MIRSCPPIALIAETQVYWILQLGNHLSADAIASFVFQKACFKTAAVGAGCFGLLNLFSLFTGLLNLHSVFTGLLNLIFIFSFYRVAFIYQLVFQTMKSTTRLAALATKRKAKKRKVKRQNIMIEERRNYYRKHIEW